MENFISTKICYNKLGCKIYSITILHLIRATILLLQYECRTCVRIWMKVNVKYTTVNIMSRVFLTVRFLSSRWRMKSDIKKKISLFRKVYVVTKKKLENRRLRTVAHQFSFEMCTTSATNMDEIWTISASGKRCIMHYSISL